jgi:hypothetical protein
LLAGIDHSERSRCSIRVGSCADHGSAARVTSSRLESFTCGTSKNMTTMVNPVPLRLARSLARRKPQSSPFCPLNEAFRPSTTRSDEPLGRGTNLSEPKRRFGKVLGLIRRPSMPFLGALGWDRKEAARRLRIRAP